MHGVVSLRDQEIGPHSSLRGGSWGARRCPWNVTGQRDEGRGRRRREDQLHYGEERKALLPQRTSPSDRGAGCPYAVPVRRSGPSRSGENEGDKEAISLRASMPVAGPCRRHGTGRQPQHRESGVGGGTGDPLRSPGLSGGQGTLSVHRGWKACGIWGGAEACDGGRALRVLPTPVPACGARRGWARGRSRTRAATHSPCRPGSAVPVDRGTEAQASVHSCVRTRLSVFRGLTRAGPVPGDSPHL